MDNIFLLIFIGVNIFLVGIFCTVATRHAYAHFKPHKAEEKAPHKPPNHDVRLPPAVREKLLHTAATKFQTVLDRSTVQLHHSLETTSVQINKRLEKLGTTIVTDEMERYKSLLDSLQKQTEQTIIGSQAEMKQHQLDLQHKLADQQATLEAKLSSEIELEKTKLVEQIDTKLSDAVASFLVETLQHNVDLGAQSDYLISMLDEHKDELRAGVKDEA